MEDWRVKLVVLWSLWKGGEEDMAFSLSCTPFALQQEALGGICLQHHDTRKK